MSSGQYVVFLLHIFGAHIVHICPLDSCLTLCRITVFILIPAYIFTLNVLLSLCLSAVCSVYVCVAPPF